VTTFAPGAHGRLTGHDLGRFPSDSLFDRIGRAVCRAGCLPRKELYESWEMARRVRRLFRGGRVVDLGGGHGLLAHVLLLLDDTSREALVVDLTLPPSHARLHEALLEEWPRLRGRVGFEERPYEDVALTPEDLVVASHACGALTDTVLELAVEARARVAVLPCCHDHARCDTGALTGWMAADLAIDAVRAVKLQECGYRVWTRAIPADVTPKNRLLLGEPPAAEATSGPRPS
jgi:methyltransferase family protein